jgi:hypothetical protein
MTIVRTVYRPKKARKKKPAPEIKQRVVTAYSPQRLARIRRYERMTGQADYEAGNQTSMTSGGSAS